MGAAAFQRGGGEGVEQTRQRIRAELMSRAASWRTRNSGTPCLSAASPSRREAVRSAESIIDVRVSDFMRWLQARGSVPVVRQLREGAELARQAAVDAAVKQLARGDDPAAVIEALSQSLTNKLMHGPTKAVSSASEGERADLVKWLSRLYPGQLD